MSSKKFTPIKSRINPKLRVKEFGDELVVRNSKLFCSVCNTELPTNKKSTIQNHLKTNSHLELISKGFFNIFHFSY